RLLVLVYFVAFLSLAVQIDGLIGAHGIVPAAEFMQGAGQWSARNAIGLARFFELPTLGWLSTSDAFLKALSYGSAALALFLMAGVAPLALSPLLWIAYLSLSIVGREFLSYQWDALLLETGLLAVFVCP